MCNLRGLLMLKLNRGDQAKQCFMEALALDVKCYEAFEQLVSGEMMTPDEGMRSIPSRRHSFLTPSRAEWEFVAHRGYREQTPADADFVRLAYQSRLRKYKHTEEHALIRKRLVDEYGLGDNPDVLFSFADALYTQLRWADCFAVTSRYAPPLAYFDIKLTLFTLSQNPQPCERTQKHDAAPHRLHVPPLTPQPEALPPRSRARRTRA